MSQYSNNIMIHNLRIGAQMVQHGIHPEVVALALNKEGISVTHDLIAAIAEPGALESLSAKPFTHKRMHEHIVAYDTMKSSLAQMASLPEFEEEIGAVLEDEN